MEIRTVKFLVKEGFVGAWTNRLMSIASISAVTACLMILGLFFLLSINVNAFAKQLSHDWVMLAYIDEKVPEDKIPDIENKIKQVPEVQSATYQSKAQALVNLKKQLGNEGYILDDFEKDNPLRAMFIIHLNDLTQAEQAVANLSKIEGVAKVKRDDNVAKKIMDFSKIIYWSSLIVMIILALMAVLIISNTIKLTVSARSTEINIMKYVGATDRFVRMPFIIEGMFIGFIGGLLALIIVNYGYFSFVNYVVRNHLNNMFAVKSSMEVFSTLSLIFMVFGVTIGTIGSFISVRKYLKV
ncbi:MAG: ABC transporter permease [Hyphomonadaceae bacterium]|nr:ABC transporter permease [Clostridia bacterium]